MDGKSLKHQRFNGSIRSLFAGYRILIRDYYLLWKEARTVSYRHLFKYADGYDILLMSVGFLGAVVNGLSLPAMLIIQSHLLNNFGSLQDEPKRLAKKVSQDSLYFVYTALASWLACYLEVSCWMHTGERQAARIRVKYLRAILRQNVGFFDSETSTAEVINSISVDTQLLQEAMSEKVGNFVKNFSQFVGGYIVASFQLWKMALLMIPFIPLLLLPGILYSVVISDFTLRMQLAYGKAGTISEQAISSVRIVYSFVTESATVKAYSESLETIVDLGKRQGIAKGLAIGSNGISFALWALLGWYGGLLVIHGEANGAQVLTSGFAMLTGGLALGNATPHIKLFFEACVAAFKIFEMIDRVPPIDLYNMIGKKLENIEGKLEFKKVNFAYPSRLEVPVLREFNLNILPGKTVALVGCSGSGKSTVISLIERYYDPLSGEIFLDGTNIRELQLKWLRDQIGLVSQEPALFAMSIKENILYGKDHATIDEVIEAAQMADAHNFIMQQPDGYNTQVGERGVQMSGGQKQRIAIARAMLKRPAILVLDEATSALDAKAEKRVQQALDKVSVGRTTLVVAHRLSTIRSADLIVVMQNGVVVERGRHKELLAKAENGVYAALVHLKQFEQETMESIEVSLPKELPTDEFSTIKSMSQRSSDEGNNGFAKHVKAARKRNDHCGASFRRLLAMSRPEWKHCVFGAIGAIGFGIVQPFYAYLVGNMVSSYYIQDRHKLREHLKIYSSLFLCLTVASFLVNHIQHYNFTVMGEYLTKRIREKMLSKLLTFEVAWFDEIENSTGALCSRLASDANKVRSLFGDRISLLAQTASAVIVSIMIGLSKAWRLALVMTAIQPLIIYCYYYRKRSLTRFAHEEAKAQQEASQVASEAVSLQRTVTAFSAQERIVSRFESKLEKTRRQTLRRSLYSGMSIGAAQFVLFSSWGLDFWYGGQLVRKEQATFGDVFKTFFVLVSTGRVLAEVGTLTPDIAKGSTAVEFVFKILDRITNIDSDKQQDWKPENIEGNIELRGVTFAYPSRPDVLILRNLNLKVKAGCTFALVGHSGSGKSTVVGLIERFYDPLSGKVMIDGKDLKMIHLQTMRQHIGLVSQEPTLFAGTIRENIAYAKPTSSEEEIIEAARAANAHNFICALPNGYSTFVGEQGLQLSGGQKQRIVIARAILKNPEILLLDEATSALDTESEGLVQAALERMMIGRTTIVIAHRLSTIKNAGTIAFMQDGGIIEEGSHEELLSRGEGGAYFSLVRVTGEF